VVEIDRVKWLAPWAPVPRDTARGLEAELAKEVAPGHQLFGLPAQAVARRLDTDDVLFLVPGNPGSDHYVVVHLTWRGVTETDTTWPVTERYQSFGQWVDTRMRTDHKDPDATR